MENTDIKILKLEDFLRFKIIEPSLVETKAFKYAAMENNQHLIKGNVDYIEQNIRNKDLGILGERFIYNYEMEKVKSYNLPVTKKVIWVAKDVGDGLGYDILSYDNEGKEMYIEVKTTTGKEKSDFFITANELLKSEEKKEKFYLYRVYDFDMKTKQGRISIRQGSLRELCVMPSVYKVVLEC